jgi:hypothetical protein
VRFDLCKVRFIKPNLAPRQFESGYSRNEARIVNRSHVDLSIAGCQRQEFLR